jgi:LDH2 family malate/lactate/ureidoglycolate dehydrogenase
MYNNDDYDFPRYPHKLVRQQIAETLAAWGMKPEHVEIAADRLIEADLRGVDTHGISMLTSYDDWRKKKWITVGTEVTVVRETPTTALIDGGGGLGFVPATIGMQKAIEKAKTMGVSCVTVRNSSHFGASGVYALMAAREGLIGFSTTNGFSNSVSPTFSAEGKLSTNPFAFAAPTKRNNLFCLDFATSTVARGKIRNAAVEKRPVPAGWINDDQGRPTTDSSWYFKGALLTPLGGTRELGSHKGYGLATMVEILSAALSGAELVTDKAVHKGKTGSMHIGHWFMVIDPKALMPPGAFEATTDQLIDDLHAATPVDPDNPVMVAGEPEEKTIALRVEKGIPIPPGLLGRVQEIAKGCNAPFLLTPDKVVAKA